MAVDRIAAVVEVDSTAEEVVVDPTLVAAVAAPTAAVAITNSNILQISLAPASALLERAFSFKLFHLLPF